MFKIIAIDADDTLWHNEPFFLDTRDEFCKLLTAYHPKKWVEEKLEATERGNLSHFGYGIKGFVLSMIETAIDLSDGQISGKEIESIIAYGKKMVNSPTNLLNGVSATVKKLSKNNNLMLLTKGDLFDQEAKIARSGLADYFTNIEIVSEKNAQIYSVILERYKVLPKNFIMIGNSPKSDILPILEIGATAVHIPYHTTWTFEVVAEDKLAHKNYYRLDHLGQFPELLEKLQTEK